MKPGKKGIRCLGVLLLLGAGLLTWRLWPQSPDPKGSVGLLTQPTTLYTIYLDLGENSWSEEDRQFQAGQLALAQDWLEEQGREYGSVLSLVTQIQDPALSLTASYQGAVGDGTGPVVEDFDRWVQDLCAGLGEKSPQERVGFLLFLPGAGKSYSMVYKPEYKSKYYYEYSILYQYDLSGQGKEWPGPAVIAHEILHLFGAVDLYPGQQSISPETALQVAQAYPQEIMLTTYDAQGKIDLTGMDQTLSPFTAYRVGLTEDPSPFQDCPEMKAAPGVWDFASLPDQN